LQVRFPSLLIHSLAAPLAQNHHGVFVHPPLASQVST
jgi:hypothetical protein